MTKIYIAFGANLSNPIKSFRMALSEFSRNYIEIKCVSGLWQSPSWPPGQGHPDFLNGVCQVEWTDTPDSLLGKLQSIEIKAGRVKTKRNAPRPLDLDILDFRGEIIENSALTLPHPRMQDRGFVLFPLAQIAPDWIDPLSKKTIDELIARLPLGDVNPMTYKGKFWEK